MDRPAPTGRTSLRRIWAASGGLSRRVLLVRAVRGLDPAHSRGPWRSAHSTRCPPALTEGPYRPPTLSGRLPDDGLSQCRAAAKASAFRNGGLNLRFVEVQLPFKPSPSPPRCPFLPRHRRAVVPSIHDLDCWREIGWSGEARPHRPHIAENHCTSSPTARARHQPLNRLPDTSGPARFAA